MSAHTAHKLAADEELVVALFDNSPVGFNLCRLDGLWLESNQAFLDMIGYSRQEADGGLTYWELTPREYDDEEQVQLASLSSTGRYGPYEKEFIRKNGTRVPVRLNGFIIERDGEKLIWSLIEDISRQRELEAKLREQQIAAEQAAKLASIGELAAGVAHEINNPLQIIEASAYELQCSLEDGEAPPADAVESIRTAVSRASAIVRGLKKFAREDSPESVLVPVSRLVEDTIALTQSRIRSHGVSLDTSVRTQRSVRCTPLGLTQVLVNLINNAYDAVHAGRGSIYVEAFDEDEIHIVLRVSDSGPGVPQELRERIFAAFFTTKDMESGTGLGLSICKRIVESVGGTIEYGTGDKSTFIVRLPAGGAPQ